MAMQQLLIGGTAQSLYTIGVPRINFSGTTTSTGSSTTFSALTNREGTANSVNYSALNGIFTTKHVSATEQLQSFNSSWTPTPTQLQVGYAPASTTITRLSRQGSLATEGAIRLAFNGDIVGAYSTSNAATNYSNSRAYVAGTNSDSASIHVNEVNIGGFTSAPTVTLYYNETTTFNGSTSLSVSSAFASSPKDSLFIYNVFIARNPDTSSFTGTFMGEPIDLGSPTILGDKTLDYDQLAVHSVRYYPTHTALTFIIAPDKFNPNTPIPLQLRKSDGSIDSGTYRYRLSVTRYTPA